MSKQSKTVYLNQKQIQFLQASQKRRAFCGGRGSGKSTVLGVHNAQKFYNLPRAVSLMAGLTYNQILTKTLPSVEAMWTRLGLQEYDKVTGLGHYVVCVKPPAHWYKPWHPPRSFEHVISFINGYAIELLSLDRPDGGRGGNYDSLDIDESALIKEETFTKVLRPMVRANRYRYQGNPLHQTICDYTSAPWLPSGQWIFKTEENAKNDPDKFFFIESTAYDNVNVLGKDYIEGMRADMSQLEFDVEVMNKRLKKMPNSFYPAFDDTKHCRALTYDYDHNEKTGLWTSTTNDVDRKRQLDISVDFNSHFTSLVVGQEWFHKNEYRFVDNIFVKQSTTNMIDELAKAFADKYDTHGKKELNIYGDREGLTKTKNTDKTFYEQFIDYLIKRGWKCSLQVRSSNPEHQIKHRVINGMLAETNERLPVIRINQNTCKQLIISIQNTPIKPDWSKDKNSERTLLHQEYATHLSDCFDYLIFGRFAKHFGQHSISYSPIYFLG